MTDTSQSNQSAVLEPVQGQGEIDPKAVADVVQSGNEGKKNDVGRPTVMTAEVLSKLVDGFSMGFSDVECCLYAGIAPASLYDYQKLHPEFAERKAHLKENPKMIAKRTVFNKLDRDAETAKWYLERKAKEEFSQRNELTGKDGEALDIRWNDGSSNTLPPNAPPVTAAPDDE